MFVPTGALVSFSLLASASNRNNEMTTDLPDIVRCLEGEEEPSENAGPHESNLVVHFDINETVLVGDDAGGDTREDSLNKIIAKSAFVKIPADSSLSLGKSMDDSDTTVPTHFWDGSVIGNTEKAPPLYTGWNWPSGCCPYYRTSFKKRSKRFVLHQDGKPYEDLYHEMEKLVAFNHPKEDLPAILSHLIPALFDTIQLLTDRSQPVRFVFRTFGTDLPEISEAVTAFARGQHPDFSDFVKPHLELPRSLLFRGRWKGNVYQLLEYDNPEKVVASGDAEIVDFIASKPMCGINDDYEFWAANGWEPWAGKPVWVPASGDCHHVLLDDNIHNLEDDSIASVRLEQTDGTYKALSGSEIQDMQGLHLIRVPTVEPILNRRWFVEQLDKAQSRFAEKQSGQN